MKRSRAKREKEEAKFWRIGKRRRGEFSGRVCITRNFALGKWTVEKGRDCLVDYRGWFKVEKERAD